MFSTRVVSDPQEAATSYSCAISPKMRRLPPQKLNKRILGRPCGTSTGTPRCALSTKVSGMYCPHAWCILRSGNRKPWDMFKIAREHTI